MEIETLLTKLVLSLVFGGIGIVLLVIGYAVFDKFLTLLGVNVHEELKKDNIAVSVVTAAFIIGIALIIFGVTN